MSDLFHVIQDAQVVLRSKGTYYQRPVFRRGDRLYAKHGGGFIRLGGGDATSQPGISYETLDLPAHISRLVQRGPLREPILPQLAAVQAAA